MKRAMLALASGVACGLTFAPEAGAQTTLRIDSWVSPRHPMNAHVLPTWAKQVEDATQGRVKINLTYPPNVNPATFFDRLTDGVTDVAWSFHGYNPGRFVGTQIVEIPGLDAEAEDASLAYQRIHAKHLDKIGEHAGIKLLCVYTHGPGVLHTRQPITSIEQFKGLKVRIGGGVAADVANALGIIQVPAPAPKVYEIVSQGVADGVFMTMEVKESFKLKEVAPYTLVLPGGFYYGSFFIGMNQAKFDRLPKADQDEITKLSGEHLAKLTGHHWAKADFEGVDIAKAAGNTITVTPPALEKAIKDRLAGIEKDWIDRAKKKGIDAESALKALRAEVQKLKGKS